MLRTIIRSTFRIPTITKRFYMIERQARLSASTYKYPISPLVTSASLITSNLETRLNNIEQQSETRLDNIEESIKTQQKIWKITNENLIKLEEKMRKTEHQNDKELLGIYVCITLMSFGVACLAWDRHKTREINRFENHK